MSSIALNTRVRATTVGRVSKEYTGVIVGFVNGARGQFAEVQTPDGKIVKVRPSRCIPV